ncbi:ABC-2 type transport system permease protein [Cytobacillus oceanisediminis]|jgi:ABC-2 type transport system permease protein|uniref:ABC-2 type transport system permease protein n=1 Tax=Cytobacillus oceanisediminis TaxID=665099 RepID=A0A2V3A889_9BACI|nr:ABC transporter permease [Cytobacillus oceanisediminis]PWW32290.1 ABC-2 type transport system permease protein [Cytobacillus oceanisediminis]
MYPVFYAQFLKDKRKPLLVLLFIGLSILATLIFGNSAWDSKTAVAIFASGPYAEEIEQKWVQLLNKDTDTEYVISEEKTAREQVREGKRDVAILVMKHDYRLITASDMPNIHLVEQEVHKVFTEEAKLQAIAGSANTADLREEVDRYMKKPPLSVQTENIKGRELTNHNMGTQLLFGFTLFIAMFTIGFKVNGINADKVSGVWNRLNLSPVSKTNMYTGHLLYSFFIGFFQMAVVFLIFKYVMDYEIGPLPIILTIAAVFTLSSVSLAMLVAGFTKAPEKFNMVYPSVTPIIPIISGVYVPPGVMDNPVFTFIADLFPLGYALEAMMDAALFGAGWSDILLPVSFMLLIAVIYMGIGINLGERGRR